VAFEKLSVVWLIYIYKKKKNRVVNWIHYNLIKVYAILVCTYYWVCLIWFEVTYYEYAFNMIFIFRIQIMNSNSAFNYSISFIYTYLTVELLETSTYFNIK